MARRGVPYADRMTMEASITLAQREAEARVRITRYHVTDRRADSYKPTVVLDVQVPAPEGYPMMEEWAARVLLEALKYQYPALF